MGAWIEMLYAIWIGYDKIVAPLVGAWIEILRAAGGHPLHRSLPSWERGLKCSGYDWFWISIRVAPLVGAWIEIAYSVSTSP